MVAVVPVTDEGLGNTSYVVEVDEGEAVVVDPFRDPRPYLRLAEERGWRLRAALETHVHADFVSGAAELAEATGAEVWAPVPEGEADGVRGIAREGRAPLGGLTVETVATPGHTPEHVAYLVRDGATPVAVFSGGTLIVGGVARPDLLGEELTEPLARLAFRSVHERLLTLPDDTPLYPTLGPGSFCSTGSPDARTSTIGEQRAANPLLSADDEDEFVARLLAGLGPYPPYFLELRDVNRAGPRVYGTAPPLPSRLSADEAQARIDAGTDVVDARKIDRFAAAHVPASLSNELRGQFAVWLGWLVDRERDFVLVVDVATDVDRAVTEARGIGYDRVVGVLDIADWEAAGQPTASLPRLDPAAVVAQGREPIDVRNPSERAAGHLPQAHLVELGRLADPFPPSERPVVTHCGPGGQRAMTAASLLVRAGHDAAALSGSPADLANALGTDLEISQ